VSFSRFSEAYNNVNAEEIEQFRAVVHGKSEFKPFFYEFDVI
jgi:hypothetical protein